MPKGGPITCKATGHPLFLPIPMVSIDKPAAEMPFAARPLVRPAAASKHASALELKVSKLPHSVGCAF